jgi:tetratricopeptide (TPR) repeat protein
MRPLTLRICPLCLLCLLGPGTPLPAQQAADAAPSVLEEALALAASGELEEALERIRPLATAAAASPRARSLFGTLLLESGRAQEAYDLLRPMATEPEAEAAVLYNAGRAAAAIGEVDEAVSFLERSETLQPGSPAARELGLLLARTGRYASAYALLKPWIAAHPDDRRATEIGALCAVQLARPVEAEAHLARLPQDEPQVQLLWAAVRQMRGDPWGAIALLEPLLEGASGAMERDVRRRLAEAHVTVGNASQAVELLEGRVAGDPAMALQLARAQYRSGASEAALATLEPVAPAVLSAVQAGGGAPAPVAPGILLEYGRLLATAGRAAEAVPFLEATTRLAPQDKEGWQQLGQALAAAGRGGEAQTAMSRFQELLAAEGSDADREERLTADLDDPTGRDLREAARLLGEEDWDGALRIARREAALAPADPRPVLLESRILLMAGRAEEALELAEALVAGLPSNADALYQRGVVHAALGDLEAAESDLRAALEVAPEHAAAMSDLAVLLADRGDVDEARALLERVLELRPGDPVATANLESLGSG